MQTEVLDDFEDPSGWSAVVSGQAQLLISADKGLKGKAMRLDFDFKGGHGFVVARKHFSLSLPERYAFRCNMRGFTPANTFELKLIDPPGSSVWWYRQKVFELSDHWRYLEIKSSEIEFAWGPAGGGAMTHVGAIEFVIAAGSGGKGTVWIEDFRFEDRSYLSDPVACASSALLGYEPRCAVDPAPQTSWRSEISDRPHWLLLDFGQERELGGVIVHWVPALAARNFDVQITNDAAAWRTVYTAREVRGELSYIYLPNTVSRYLRMNLYPQGIQKQGFGIVDIEIKSYDFSRSINAFFQNLAKHEPKGLYPKYLYGEQTYWSPVATPEGGAQGLLNEEGMVEIDRGSVSIEPFLYIDDKLLTWADAALAQELEQGSLPIPSSLWRKDGVALKITAFAAGDPGAPVLYIRYRVENDLDRPRRVCLFVAVRPLQVTPPWQAFHTLGGVSPITELAFSQQGVWVNRSKIIIPLSAPDRFGAATFDQGGLSEYLKTGELPRCPEIVDSFGYAAGALRYTLDLTPRGAQEIFVAAPFGATDSERPRWLPQEICGPWQFEQAVRAWQAKLGAVEIHLPPAARGLTDAFRTAAAHILINRDGPALQPGPRRYTRSWIRDGATMVAALLRVGAAQEACDFIRWYAQYQASDGKVPCCVDRDGPDWLPEYDSQGEFLYTLMECFRFTGDKGLLTELWPKVVTCVDYIEELRRQRLTPEYQTAEKRACYGLLPESVSHEGYLAHAVHAYWDDFWALRGLRDAAAMAEIVGDEQQALRLAASCDAFGATLRASIQTTLAERDIAYIPGSVELADFDPTATANAVALIEELPAWFESAIGHTFDRYVSGFRERFIENNDWTNYSPYEIRTIAALVRLSRRQEAHEVLKFFLADRRPPPWNQWAEIAWRDPKSPAHIGDMPHTWIGAEYILALRSLFAFEREANQGLIVAAGIRDDWLADDFEVLVKDLPTYYGRLCYTLRRESAHVLRFSLSGDLTVPPAKIIVKPPLLHPIEHVKGDGVAAFDAASVTLNRCPADVTIKH